MERPPDPSLDLDDPPPNTPPRRRTRTPDLVPSDAHVALTEAVVTAQRMTNQAAAMTMQLVVSQFDRAVLDEEAAGRAVHPDGPMDRAFALNVAKTLHVSRYAARTLLASGLLLRDHCPATLAVFEAGGCTQAQAFLVAEYVELDPALLPVSDAAAARIAGSLPVAQLQRALDRLQAKLAPVSAVEDARITAGYRSVTARPRRHGMGVLTITSSAAVIAGLYDAIHQAAVSAHGNAGETRAYQALMADAAAEAILKGLDLGVRDGSQVDPAVPDELLSSLEAPSVGRIQAQITVTVPAATAVGLSNEPGELAGMGPIDADQARHIVAVTRSLTRAEVDPITSEVLGFDSHDRYMPTALRKYIALRQPVCPCGCERPTARADLDHVIRVEHDGRTRHTNLQGLCRPTHRWIKDGLYVDVKTLPDGTIAWRNRWGGHWTEKPLLTAKATASEEPCPF